MYMLKICQNCVLIWKSEWEIWRKADVYLFIRGQSCTYYAWIYNLKLRSSMDSNPKVLQTVALELFPASLSRKNYSRRIWKTIQLLWPPTATLSFLIIQDLNLIWSGKKSVFISSAQCYSLGNVCLWFPPRDDSKPVFCSRFLHISYRFDLKLSVIFYDYGEGHMNIRGAGGGMDFYPASPF